MRTLVWESPSNSVRPIVIQIVLFGPFLGIYPREVVRLTGGLPHQSADWFAMTGNSINSQFVGQLSKPDMHIILYLVSYILYLLRGFLRSIPLTILLKIPRCALRTGGSFIKNIDCEFIGFCPLNDKLECVELFGEWFTGRCGTRPCPPHL